MAGSVEERHQCDVSHFTRNGDLRRAFLTTFGGGATNHGFGSGGFLGSVDDSE